ncbi:MAG: RHS repeat-associated core domain-containing protein [Bacteroidales bacterium]|nr:RHS repeat-associated core domain-containing protein [Bacteroidales bacterium]
MKHHSLISLLLAFAITWPIQAQVVPVHSVTSPEVSGLGEYGKVPVSLYTGIPNISIPLHEAKFGKYSLPISADYHLGSVRPNDPPGCLGLGWSLAADFSISRSVRGVCDETRSRGASVGNGYYWHTGDMHDVVDDPTLFAGITRDHLSGSSVDDDSWYELSADEFSFTLPGCSGNFYLNENGGWTVVCDRDVKVEFNPSNGFADCSDLTSRIPGIDRWEGRRYKDCFFIRFTLVADDGVRYTFGGVDATDFSIPYYSRSNGEIVATAWHLKRIETPEGYTVSYDYLHDISEESIMVDLRYSPGGSSLEAPLGFSSPGYLYSNSQGRSAFTGFLLYSVNLRSITTPNERISFEYHPDIHYGDIYAHESGEALYWDRSGSDGLYRTDRYSMVQEDPAGQFRKLFPEISGSTPSEVRESIAGHLRSYFLYRISIDNIRGGRDMSIFFSHVTGNRRKIDRIAWRAGIYPVAPDYISGGGLMIPVYRIPENDSDVDMPEYSFTYNGGSMPRNFVFPRTDRWGFYNGTEWHPAENWPGPGNSPISVPASKYETLKSVTWPTGGRSEYEYENHDFSRSVLIPGLAPVDTMGMAGGLRIRQISNYDRLDSLVTSTRYHYRESMGSSRSSGIAGPVIPYLVRYRMQSPAGDNLLLSMTGEGGFPPPVTRMNTPPVSYSCVLEERIDADGRSAGCTVYHYSNYGTDIFGDCHDDAPAVRSANITASGMGLPYTSRSLERGQLLRKDFFSSDGSLVRREDTRYALVNADSLLTATQRYLTVCADPANHVHADIGWLTDTLTGSYLPVSTETTQYDGQTPLTTREETDYNASFLPVEKRSYLSDSRVRVQHMRYAVEDPAYAWLQSAHILNLPVSTTTTLDGQSSTISQHLANARSDGRALPYPESIQQSTSEHPEPWTVYEALSADIWGNPTEIVEQGRHSVLLWGRDGQVLSARIDGMTYDGYAALQQPSVQSNPPVDTYLPPDLYDDLVLPDGVMASRYFYDGNLQLTAQMSPDRFMMQYGYDALGRLRESWFEQARPNGTSAHRTVSRYDYHLHNGLANDDVQATEGWIDLSSASDPIIPEPSSYTLTRGHATEIPLSWNRQGGNSAAAYAAQFVTDDEMTVGFRIPRFICDRDVLESALSYDMMLHANLWKGDENGRELFCRLPFQVDLTTMECRLADGRDSIVLTLPPDRYVLEYRGLYLGALPDEDADQDPVPAVSPTSSNEHMGNSTAVFRLECLPLLPERPAVQLSSWNSITEEVSRDGSIGDVMRTKSYKDDFGRDYARHSIGASPDGGTLITLQEYDAWGRPSRSWLPAVSSAEGYHSGATQLRSWSVQSNGDASPYSVTTYEQSPLDRVLGTCGPGEDWHSHGKSVRTSYLTNETTEPELSCLDLSVSFDGSGCTLTSSGVFASGSLSVVMTEDEDGNTAYEFTDRLGRKLLARKILADGSGNIRLHDTYYIYDGMDRLVAVLPPALSEKLTQSQATQADIDRYAYLYRYDGRGRQCMKKLPGAQWRHSVYDGADRIVFEQDGNRRQEGRAVCHLYDIHGRECVRLSVRRTLSAGQMCEGIPFVRHVGANGQFGGYGFEGDTLLLEDAQILSLSYYDSYGFMNGPATGLPSDAAQDSSVNPAPTGLQTGSWTALIEEGHVTGEGVWTGMWYDRRGRMIHSRSAWPQGGLQTEDVAYDFLGSPVEKHLTQRHHSGADTVSEDLLYTYDNQERLLTVSHSLNGAPYVQLQSNTYDALGRLSATSHGTSASLTEQRSYNVRSQPTSISSGLFTEHLYYNAARAASSVPRYNGNISSMTWKASGDSWMRIYDFGYDGLDRLTAARYLNENIALCCDNYSAEFAYDIQGNVTSVSRRSMSGRNSVLLDNLQLTYDGNRLVSVEDSATSSQGKAMGFRDMAHEECEYGYDANGNTVRDLNRGVGSVCYDVTDHPSVILADSVRVGYGYLASGIKTRASVSSPRDSIVTEYRGNHVWRNGRLSYILFDGGYMDCEASGTPYVFYLRDHLGNNRVAALSTGEVLQVNNYYPFGLNFATNEQSSTRQPGRPVLMSDDPFDGTIGGAIDIPLDPGEDIILVIPREDQPWRFGGKELLSASSLDLYDFEARLYDPALGRFLQPDPMAEKYYDVSPYGYCHNVPIMNVDPTGTVDWNTVGSGVLAIAGGVCTFSFCLGANLESGGIASALLVPFAIEGLGSIGLGTSYVISGILSTPAENDQSSNLIMSPSNGLAKSVAQIMNIDSAPLEGATGFMVGILSCINGHPIFTAISMSTTVLPIIFDSNEENNSGGTMTGKTKNDSCCDVPDLLDQYQMLFLYHESKQR